MPNNNLVVTIKQPNCCVVNYNLVGMVNFGSWLRNRRKALDLLQSDVAQRAGVSISYISTLERGQKHSTTGAELTPDRDKVIAIAKAVNGDIDEALLLCGYAPADTPQPKTAKEALLAIEKLIPGFEGVLWFENMTDEDAERMLDAFKAIARLHK
jgi:transcriptional regulator with XRE-family HTH domain